MVRPLCARDAWSPRVRCGRSIVVVWSGAIVPFAVGIPMLMVSVALLACGGKFAHHPEVSGLYVATEVRLHVGAGAG